jgi:four helix bundle protein
MCVRSSRARSDQEFVSKIGGALQEIDESSLWLELLNEECRISSSSTDPIKTEANELLAIMSSMLSRATNRH